MSDQETLAAQILRDYDETRALLDDLLAEPGNLTSSEPAKRVGSWMSLIYALDDGAFAEPTSSVIGLCVGLAGYSSPSLEAWGDYWVMLPRSVKQIVVKDLNDNLE